MMSWIGIIGWMILSAVMIIVDRAKPDDPIFMPDRTFFEQANVPYVLRTTWNEGLVTYIFYLLILGFVLGSIGILINFARHRRQDDVYRIHLILLTAISAAGIAYRLL
jgi:hypothetical protein